MAGMKKRLVAIIGIVIGILTLSRVRKRRSKSSDSKRDDVDHEDLDSASGHAQAAADHAKLAAQKAVEEQKKKKA